MAELYSCRVKSVLELTDTVFSIEFESQELCERARAGEFLHISTGAPRLLRRPVSICCAENGTVTCVIEKRGAGTQALSMLEPGDTAEILGPLGHGFDAFGKRRIIVVGGGNGAAPMLYLSKTVQAEVSAVLGFRDKGRIILKDEFESCCAAVHLVTDDGSAGTRGFVTAPLETCLSAGGYDGVYACGPRAMLRAVYLLCAEYNVPLQVSLEERMGCGVGACVVCAVKTIEKGREQMRRVCKDGPVFNADEVIW